MGYSSQARHSLHPCKLQQCRVTRTFMITCLWNGERGIVTLASWLWIHLRLSWRKQNQSKYSRQFLLWPSLCLMGHMALEETLKRKAERQQVCLSNLFLMYRDLLYALEASIPTRLQSKMPYTHKKRLLQLQHISRASLYLPDSGVCRLPGVQWMPWGGVLISRPFVYDLLSKFPLWIFFCYFCFLKFLRPDPGMHL